jgi:hypothetical protein
MKNTKKLVSELKKECTKKLGSLNKSPEIHIEEIGYVSIMLDMLQSISDSIDLDMQSGFDKETLDSFDDD